MPSSHYCFIPEILTAVEQLNPLSILDIGIGFGKWGHLFREYLDINQGNIDRSTWKRRIDGIEIFPDYIQEHQKHIYSQIIVGDIYDELDFLPSYDLIFAGDVVEHLEKSQAVTLISRLRLKCSTLIVAIPLGEWPQAALNGNFYESHLSTWEEHEFVPGIVNVKVLPDGRRLGLIIYTGRKL